MAFRRFSRAVMSRERMSSRAGSHGQHGIHVKLENTYRLEPSRKLKIGEIRRAVATTMEEYLGEKVYSQYQASHWSKDLGQILKNEVKLFGDARYRIVVTLTIVSKTDGERPSLALTSQAVWQPDFDNFIDVVYENASLYAAATVYLVYRE